MPDLLAFSTRIIEEGIVDRAARDSVAIAEDE